MQLGLIPTVISLYKNLNRKVNENIFPNTLKINNEANPHGASL